MNSQTKKADLKRTFEAFKEKPKTMKMVAAETDIMRPSVCRHVATLRKYNKIALVKVDYCPITAYKAQYLTTAPEIVKKCNNQIKLEI